MKPQKSDRTGGPRGARAPVPPEGVLDRTALDKTSLDKTALHNTALDKSALGNDSVKPPRRRRQTGRPSRQQH